MSITELASVRGPLGLPVERDLYFTASRTLSGFAAEAHRRGPIVA